MKLAVIQKYGRYLARASAPAGYHGEILAELREAFGVTDADVAKSQNRAQRGDEQRVIAMDPQPPGREPGGGAEG